MTPRTAEKGGNKREVLQELLAATVGQREDGAKLSILGTNEKRHKNLGRQEVREEKTDQSQKRNHGRQGREMVSSDRCLLHPSKPSGKPLNCIVFSAITQNQELSVQSAK